ACLTWQSQERSQVDIWKRSLRLVASKIDRDKQVFVIIFRIDLDLLTLQILALARRADDEYFGDVCISRLYFHPAVDADDENLSVVETTSKATSAVPDEDFRSGSELAFLSNLLAFGKVKAFVIFGGKREFRRLSVIASHGVVRNFKFCYG